MEIIGLIIGFGIVGVIVLMYGGLFVSDFMEKLKLYKFENKKEKIKWAFKYLFYCVMTILWLFLFYHLMNENFSNPFVAFIGWGTILIGAPYLLNLIVKEYFYIKKH